jgi:phage tail sheath protein FI
MPVTVSYPGVYIEEIPSGVRTITGVATSITAFAGRTLRGSDAEPVLVTSFGEFERRFGGLHRDFPLGYAVRDFFLNGGSQALIVRLHHEAVRAANDDLQIEAASPGAWGSRLTYSVDTAGIDAAVAERFGLDEAELFNLTVYDLGTGQVEMHRNVSIEADAGARRLDRVLATASNLVRVRLTDEGAPDLPDEKPENTDDDANPGNPDADPANFAAFEDGVDGAALEADDYTGSKDSKTGLFRLEKADLFNLLCIPADTRGGDTDASVYQHAMKYCADRRAMLLVDPPAAWSANKDTAAANAKAGLTALGLSGTFARNAALYFPRLQQADPALEGQVDTFVPCGAVAGVMARTDSERGVWKAPAGIDAGVLGVQGFDVTLNDPESGQLNPLGINCLRTFPVVGHVVWGARTLRGADQLADEYKYVPVRRTALFIEETLFRGLKWVVFEPNDEPLWAQIRLNIGAFMQGLFRQGAFQGTTPREAYFVKCDKETTTQADINLGIVNVVVGFAPLKPAEFVVVRIQQMAGQVQA